jgi:hypothetical protein
MSLTHSNSLQNKQDNRPIIVLDFDGTMNPVPFYEQSDHDFVFDISTWLTSTNEDGSAWRYKVNLSTEMAAEIIQLGTVMWLTSWIRWADDANTVIAPLLGWERLPIVPFEKNRPDWKYRAMQQLLAEAGPPVVWIDDDAKQIMEEERSRIPLDPHDRLIVCAPWTDYGMRRSDFNQIASDLKEK